MHIVVDINKLKDNLKDYIKDKLFCWIDIRNSFYGIGIAALKELLRYDNIGLFTDNLKLAIEIRNFNKYVPIIVEEIETIDQVYDVVMNNLILSTNDLQQLQDIKKLQLKDKLSLAIQISVNFYDDGLNIKNYIKCKELCAGNDLEIAALYAKVSDEKNDAITDYEDLINKENINSFAIGYESEILSDGFAGKDLEAGVLKFSSNVLKSFKINKKEIFGGQKIKKDCYGIKIKAPYFDISKHKTIIIDDNKWRIIAYLDNVLYLIGENHLKAGKKVYLDNYYDNYYISFQKPLYLFNGKISNFDYLD